MISYGPPTPVGKGSCGCNREWFLVVKSHVKTDLVVLIPSHKDSPNF